ncbi:MAG: WD40 repeat domain-containing protein [Fimbriimonadaceae bacterium]|nr:WD40 repeat domain-containing protein [Fimbriimonadaceae bacterium]QYK59138.1 MAG: WD40 repeat domain-containing protein [Fimbriimonadaceae bacterium]
MQVDELACDDSGNLLASRDINGNVKLWDLRLRRWLADLTWKGDSFTSIAFLPQNALGAKLICGTTNGELVAFDEAWQPVATRRPATPESLPDVLSGKLSLEGRIQQLVVGDAGRSLIAVRPWSLLIYDLDTLVEKSVAAPAMRDIETGKIKPVTYSMLQLTNVATSPRTATFAMALRRQGLLPAGYPLVDNPVPPSVTLCDTSQMGQSSLEFPSRSFPQRRADSQSQFELQQMFGEQMSVYDLAYDPTGTYVAAATEYCSLAVWEATKSKRLLEVKGDGPFIKLAFDGQGKALASLQIRGGKSLILRLHDLGSASERFKAIEVPEGTSHSLLAFTPDGSRVLVATDRMLYSFDSKSGEPAAAMSVALTAILPLKTTANVAVGTRDGRIFLSNSKGQTLVEVERSADSQSDTELFMGQTGILLVTYGKLLELRSLDGELMHSERWNEGSAGFYTASGMLILDKFGRVRKISTSGDVSAVESGLGPSPTSLPYTNSIGDTQRILFRMGVIVSGLTGSSSNGSYSTRVDLRAILGQMTWQKDTTPVAVASDQNGKLFAFWRQDQGFINVGSPSGESRQRLPMPGTGRQFLQLSQDGLYLFAASDSMVRVWSLRARRLIFELRSPVESVAFSDNLLVAVASGGEIKIYDARTNSLLRTVIPPLFSSQEFLANPGDDLLSATPEWRESARTSANPSASPNRLAMRWLTPAMAFDPKGLLLGISDVTGASTVVEVKSGNVKLQQIATDDRAYEQYPAWWPWAANFSEDGEWFFTGSTRGKVHAVRINSGKEIVMGGHGGPCFMIWKDLKSGLIATGGKDMTARFWNLSQGREVLRMRLGKSGQWLATTPDGHFTGTVGLLATARFASGAYSVPLETLADHGFLVPSLVDLVLGGKSVTQASDLANFALTRPKILKVRVLAQTQSDAQLDVHVRSTQSDCDRILVRSNNTVVLAERILVPSNSERVVRLRVPIPMETNDFSISAFSTAGAESDRATISVFNMVGRKPNLYVISVGVNGEGISFAESDASAIVRTLKQVGTSSFNSVKSDLLVGTAATHRAINEAVRRIGDQTAAEDTFIFYFAGHGKRTTFVRQDAGRSKAEAFIVAAPEGPGSAPGRLGSSDLALWATWIRARKQVFVLDACKSGTLGRGFEDLWSGSGFVQSLQDNAKAYVLAATQPGESEVVNAGGLRLTRGFLTQAVIEGLSGRADTNRDGRIAVDELGKWTGERVPELYRHHAGGDIRTPRLYQPLGGAANTVTLASTITLQR